MRYYFVEMHLGSRFQLPAHELTQPKALLWKFLSKPDNNFIRMLVKFSDEFVQYFLSGSCKYERM